MPEPVESPFSDRLADALDAAGSPACVGLDPVLDRIPDAVGGETATERIERFCRGVIEAIDGVVGVVKPQAACFERYGSRGWAALERVVEAARRAELIVILDAKRQDIGSSAKHYAASVRAIGADAVTVGGYMGPSTIEPFAAGGVGVFVLVRTSNPDSDRVQAVRTVSGSTVGEEVARMVADLGADRRGTRGLSDIGAVVGATKAEGEGLRLRRLMPDQVLLVPGVGAQGAGVEDVRPLLRPGGADRPGTCGLVVNASRSVLYPSGHEGAPWQDGVAREAARLRDALRGLIVPAGA